MDDKSDTSEITRDKLFSTMSSMEENPPNPPINLYHFPPSPRVSTSYHPETSPPSLSDVSVNKTRRRSTINSYNLVNYYALPRDPQTLKAIRQMTEAKAMKNVIVLGVAFMFANTAFVSLQSLQSIMNSEGGVGVVSLSCIYATTVISCLLAPWLINKLTSKWTMAIAFFLFTGYFAGNFYPKHFMLIPLGLTLGFLTGPLWSAQATFITTVALTYSQHAHIFDQDVVVNKFMGIFCGFYRSSYIWGNLITTLMLSNNQTLRPEESEFDFNRSVTRKICGAADCSISTPDAGVEKFDISNSPYVTEIPDDTKYMLLSIYLGCGIMGAVVLMVLLDNNTVTSKSLNSKFSLTTKELILATIKMLKDSRCQLLIPLGLFVGLEQGFIFGDFTKSYVNCTLGIHSVGPILMCFGAVSAVSSIVIGCVAEHIKRFAFITAGATFNAGILIVMWLWKPVPTDIPNFFVVSACIGLCDAIWQTQTYTLFGVLFQDKQEAAFASYRMFFSTGCAVSFGYSYFLCVETKVYILAAMLALALLLYSVIEMKVQLQSQHIKDIVAL
ncbi:hypothetical protein ACJMK2_012964 [Sinanodonta woodiana]|uniref:UNC93-like protein n=1 Tax=Sinanodonta woodiana TaxID=1069815 RepID=A0ABD3VCU4_SINWO